MNVPAIHYVYFWFINSLMVLGTGFVMGFVILFAAHIALRLTLPGAVVLDRLLFSTWGVFPLGFLFIYQFFIASFFWGKRRGQFEYSFLEKSAERGKLNPDLGILLKDLKQELRFGDPEAANLKIDTARKVFPDNFVVHFEYAISCERVGLSEDAIAAYETATKLLPKSAEALNTYVEKQISRVKLKGPTKRSKAPGLQYIIY